MFKIKGYALSVLSLNCQNSPSSAVRVYLVGSNSIKTVVDATATGANEGCWGVVEVSTVSTGLRLNVPGEAERVLHVSWLRKCFRRPEAEVKALLQFLQKNGLLPS